MMIPMVNLQRQYSRLKQDIQNAVISSLDACYYIFGPDTQAFEIEAAEYCSSKHALAVASGTDALQLALRAIGVTNDDEIITTAFTFIGTAEAISYTGATPIFVDIDPVSFNIDLNQIENAITDKTKAVVIVHVFGQPIDMDPLVKLCQQRGIKIVEDCAHAFGADYKGKKVGSIGDVGCFSFYPSKNLGAFGDAGLITTQNDEIADTIKVLRNHGSKNPPEHIMIGYNSRLDDIQAAILRVKLKHIDDFNSSRRKNAHLYNSLLQNEHITTPSENDYSTHIYHQYTIRIEDRDRKCQALKNAGIGFGLHYAIPLHQQPVYQPICQGLSLPHAEQASKEVLCLPMCPELNAEEINTVCRTLLETS